MQQDWMNEEDYEYPDDMTPDGWTFEFLRRNTKYQEDYQHVAERRAALTDAHGKLTQKNIDKWRKDSLFWVYVPTIKDGETDDEWRRRIALTTNVEPKMTPFEKYFREKWYLKTDLLDPFSFPDKAPEFVIHLKFPYFPPDIEELSPFFYYPTDRDGHESLLLEQEPQYATVVIDLNHPLDEQLKIIKTTLKKQKKRRAKDVDLMSHPKKPKEGLDQFRKLLRLLDAKNISVTHSQIAQVLFQAQEIFGYDPDGEKLVSRLWKQAKEYRDRRYRLIPQILNSTK